MTGGLGSPEISTSVFASITRHSERTFREGRKHTLTYFVSGYLLSIMIAWNKRGT
jgi:hypothetical protein